jgi:hypothetical protein
MSGDDKSKRPAPTRPSAGAGKNAALAAALRANLQRRKARERVLREEAPPEDRTEPKPEK